MPGWKVSHTLGDVASHDPPLPEAAIAGLGTITIQVWRSEMQDEGVQREMKPSAVTEGPIHEKMLKGRAVTLAAT